jgi:hypothetical protein
MLGSLRPYKFCSTQARTISSVGNGRRPPRSRPGPLDLSGQRLEVNVLLHHLQHVSQAVQLGFAFFGGKQAFFDHSRPKGKD